MFVNDLSNAHVKKTNRIAEYSLLADWRCHRVTHTRLILMQICIKKKQTKTSNLRHCLIMSFVALDHIFCSAFLPHFKSQLLKNMNYSIQFQWMMEKKKNEQNGSSISHSEARLCLVPAHVRFAEWMSLRQNTSELLTGVVWWRRYRHSIKFVYSLHEYMNSKGGWCAGRPEKQHRTMHTINWPKSRESTTWDFHLLLFFFSSLFAWKMPHRFHPIKSWSIITYQFITAAGVRSFSCIKKNLKKMKKKCSFPFSQIIKLFTFTYSAWNNLPDGRILDALDSITCNVKCLLQWRCM